MFYFFKDIIFDLKKKIRRSDSCDSIFQLFKTIDYIIKGHISIHDYVFSVSNNMFVFVSFLHIRQERVVKEGIGGTNIIRGLAVL